jgi:hypothetical protein
VAPIYANLPSEMQVRAIMGLVCVWRGRGLVSCLCCGCVLFA